MKIFIVIANQISYKLSNVAKSEQNLTKFQKIYMYTMYTYIRLWKMLELYIHNIVLWKRKLKMAADIAQFVAIFCSEKENINLKILIGDIALNVIST